MSRFTKIKKMNQSENTLQSLAATNCTRDVQECTRVHYFVRMRTLFKVENYEFTRLSQRIYIQMLRRIYTTSYTLL